MTLGGARMPRLIAVAAGLALWAALPCASAPANTRIWSVAGEGTATGPIGPPSGVADTAVVGHFLFVDGCHVRKVTSPSNADSGPTSLDAGLACSSDGTTFDGTLDAIGQNLTDGACCVTRSGPNYLLADHARIQLVTFNDGKIRTLAGSDSPPIQPGGCQRPAPADPDPRTAELCPILDVASDGVSRLLFVDDSTRSGGPLVYEVDYANPASPTISKVAGGGCAPETSGTPPAQVCLGTSGPGPSNRFGLAYDGSASGGFLLVDSNRHVVRQFSSTDFATSSTSIVAGGDLQPGSADGHATDTARLNFPLDVARHSRHASIWFISDSGNCRIRRYAAGTVTTIAGTVCIADGDIGDGGLATTSVLYGGRLAFSDAGLYVTDPVRDRIRLVDRTAILTGPAEYTQSQSAEFTFASLDSPAEFLCRLDGALDPGPPQEPVYTDCTAQPHQVTAGEGAHVLDVYTGDADLLRTQDPTPARWSWTIDDTDPDPFAITAPGSGSNGIGTTPEITWDAASDATAGIDHYELTVDGARNGGDLACCSFTLGSPLTEGAHTASVRAVDRAGNFRDSATVVFDVGLPPGAAFTIAPNPVLVGSTVTFTSAAADADGGIARYEWDLDGDGTYETDGGANAVATRSYSAAGTITIGHRVTDAAGKIATATGVLTVNSLTSAPQHFGVTVDSGAQYTNDPDVTINATFPSTITSMLFSNDGGFLAPTTFAPTAATKWKLDSSGPERLPKTVYVRFLTGPLVSETFTDDIILDETPPKVSSASVTSASSSAAVVAAKKKRTYKLKLKASDNVSGVAGVQITTKKKKPGKLLKYRRTVKVKATSSKLYVRAKDKAGNYSKWRKAKR